MNRLAAILTILLVMMVGCEGNKQSSDNFITVDVTANYPKKELILQDFMDVEYIPLETDSAFITMAYIQAIGKEVIIVRNRSMFASDGNIFIFDRKGKSRKIINCLGQGGEEYTFILGITLNEENNEIFVNDNRSRKVLVYDLSGNFKRSFNHKDGTFRSRTSNYIDNIYYDQINNLDGNNLIIHEGTNNYDETKRGRFWIISNQDGRVKKEIQIPYKDKKSTLIRVKNTNGETIFDVAARNQELIPYQDSWILVEPSSDTIYRYQTDKSMTPFIVRTPSINSMSPEIFLFPGVLCDRYYFMQTAKKEADITTKTGFPRTDLVYDRHDKAIYEYTVLNDDFSTKKTVNMVYEITLINDKELAFVQKLDAPELIEAYEDGKLKGKLKEIASTLNEESNPVLMLAKYRK